MQAIEVGGNDRVNGIFEARLSSSSPDKPTLDSSAGQRKDFIEKKYVNRDYFAAVEYKFSKDRLERAKREELRRKVEEEKKKKQEESSWDAFGLDRASKFGEDPFATPQLQDEEYETPIAPPSSLNRQESLEHHQEDLYVDRERRKSPGGGRGGGGLQRSMSRGKLTRTSSSGRLTRAKARAEQEAEFNSSLSKGLSLTRASSGDRLASRTMRRSKSGSGDDDLLSGVGGEGNAADAQFNQSISTMRTTSSAPIDGAFATRRGRREGGELSSSRHGGRSRDRGELSSSRHGRRSSRDKEEEGLSASRHGGRRIRKQESGSDRDRDRDRDREMASSGHGRRNRSRSANRRPQRGLTRAHSVEDIDLQDEDIQDADPAEIMNKLKDVMRLVGEDRVQALLGLVHQGGQVGQEADAVDARPVRERGIRRTKSGADISRNRGKSSTRRRMLKKDEEEGESGDKDERRRSRSKSTDRKARRDPGKPSARSRSKEGSRTGRRSRHNSEDGDFETRMNSSKASLVSKKLSSHGRSRSRSRHSNEAGDMLSECEDDDLIGSDSVDSFDYDHEFEAGPNHEQFGGSKMFDSDDLDPAADLSLET